jgi:hypothetical protein
MLTNVDTEFEIFRGNIIKVIVDKNISTHHLELLTNKIKTFNPFDLRIDYDVNYKKLRVDNAEEVDLSDLNMEHAIIEFIDMLDIKSKEEVSAYVIELYKKFSK